MRQIYADNSSTSFPKAPGVSDAIKNFIDNVGCNINRGGYSQAYDTALEVLETRKKLCKLFNFNEPRNVIFTPGITYSLNMLLKGFLKHGNGVITTSMEHNGVMRPLYELSKMGVTYSIAECDIFGRLEPKNIQSLITKDTKAVIMTHASNVSGTILPISDVYEICQKRGIKLIVDSAQTAGDVNVSMEYADAIAFTCHKSLLATQGLGGFLIKSDFAEELSPIITGGTGSKSHEIEHPLIMPDKFEPGTMNIPAIIGLKKSLHYIESEGVPKIHAKKMTLTNLFLEKTKKAVNVIGMEGFDNRLSVVSLDFKNQDNAEISAILDSDYGIKTRCGLHCAPTAHKTLRTFPRGTVRFSFGYFNTADEVEYIADSINSLLLRCR